MTMKCTCSHRRQAHVNLARTKAKKSILKRIKANLLKFSNGDEKEEEAIKKFNLKSPSNHNTHHIEIHQVTSHFSSAIVLN